ncbi:hypothetical protein [Helicobacter sp.]|nr:hypothetical protein [Helicobacter sp.]
MDCHADKSVRNDAIKRILQNVRNDAVAESCNDTMKAYLQSPKFP